MQGRPSHLTEGQNNLFTAQHELVTSLHPTKSDHLLLQARITPNLRTDVVRPVQTFIVLMDNSASMNDPIDRKDVRVNKQSRLSLLKTAMIQTVKRMHPNDIVSLLAYNHAEEVIIKKTTASDPNIENLINKITAHHDTALEMAFSAIGLKGSGNPIEIEDIANTTIIIVNDGANSNQDIKASNLLDLLKGQLDGKLPRMTTITIGVEPEKNMMAAIRKESNTSGFQISHEEDIQGLIENLSNILNIATAKINLNFTVNNQVFPSFYAGNIENGQTVVMTHEVNVKYIDDPAHVTISSELGEAKILLVKNDITLNPEVIDAYASMLADQYNKMDIENDIRAQLLSSDVLPLVENTLLSSSKERIVKLINANHANSELDIRFQEIENEDYSFHSRARHHRPVRHTNLPSSSTSSSSSANESSAAPLQNATTTSKPITTPPVETSSQAVAQVQPQVQIQPAVVAIEFNATKHMVKIENKEYEVLTPFVDATNSQQKNYIVLDATFEGEGATLIDLDSLFFNTEMLINEGTNEHLLLQDLLLNTAILAEMISNPFNEVMYKDNKAVALDVHNHVHPFYYIPLAENVHLRVANKRQVALYAFALLANLAHKNKLPKGTLRYVLGVSVEGEKQPLVIFSPKEGYFKGQRFLIDPNNPAQKIYNLMNPQDCQKAIQDYKNQNLQGVLDECLVTYGLAERGEAISSVYLDKVSERFVDKLFNMGLVDPITFLIPANPVRIKDDASMQIYDEKSLRAFWEINKNNPLTNVPCVAECVPAIDTRNQIINLIRQELALDANQAITSDEPQVLSENEKIGLLVRIEIFIGKLNNVEFNEEAILAQKLDELEVIKNLAHELNVPFDYESEMAKIMEYISLKQSLAEKAAARNNVQRANIFDDAGIQHGAAASILELMRQIDTYEFYSNRNSNLMFSHNNNDGRIGNDHNADKDHQPGKRF